MTLSHNFLGSILLGCCLLTSCGRKQRSIFNFHEVKKIKINKLGLPAIKGIQCHRDKHDIIISWHSITHKNLIGYNIYHVPRGLVVSKRSLNKKPLKKTTFFHITKKHSCYLVRGVFSLHTQTIEGPASQVCCCL